MTPPSPNRAAFGEYFRRALAVPTRIAQQVLVHELGLDAASVSRYATGEDLPTPDKLEEIIDYFRHQGRWSVDDCAEVRRIHLLAQGEADPKPRGRPTPPQPPAQFIGRERDVARLLEVLRQPLVRPVTLVGYGGVGKTALAQQVAAAYASGDGGSRTVEVITLEHVGARAEFWTAIARQLRVREESRDARAGVAADHLDALRQRVIRRLRRAHLLVLDGCEGVASDASPIADLTGACPWLRTLLTTRVYFSVENVYRHQVEPLAVPAERGNLDLAALGGVPTVRLFVELVRVAWPGFTLTHRNADDVARLCRLMEGLPLAIRLVAANCNPGNLHDVTARLERRLSDLPAIPLGLPGRHRSLGAALDVSYGLLPDEDKRLFRRLGVCHGCSREALRQLAVLDGPTQATPADPYALVRSSLLAVQETAAGEHFRMLEIIREYALSKLEQEREYPLVAAWHRRYFGAVVERAWAGLSGSRALAALRELDREHDNVLALLRRAAEQDAHQDAARLAHALRPYWEARGRLSEGRAILGRLLARPQADRQRAWLHLDSGELALLQGDVAAMEDHAARAGALFLGTRDDPEMAAAILRLIGDGHLSRGEYRAAIDQFEQALDCYRVSPERQETPEVRRRTIAIMRRLGLAHRHQAKSAVDQARWRATAVSWYERALRLSREIPDESQTALVLADLASVLRLSGTRADLERAMAMAEESLASARRLDAPLCLAHAAQALGSVALYRAGLLRRRGRSVSARSSFARAEAAIGERLAIVWELEILYDTAACLFDLAGIASVLGHEEHAGLLLGACEALMEAEDLRPAPADRATYAQMTGRLRQEFNAALQDGRERPLREVVAMAIEHTRTREATAPRPPHQPGRTRRRRRHRRR
ncbi:MAG TPA: AAA family ATPase [Thermomicrobiales bacterium]|nr:AAA family ATPase [Thermomicrobiales bacterium]